MKVRQLIKELEKLDQDTDIWVFYDKVTLLKPEIDVIDPNDLDGKPGDYYFTAWL